MSELITLSGFGSYSRRGVVCCVARYESQLTEQLDEAEQTILTKLIRSQHEIDSITARENFILGFRLGIRIMAECTEQSRMALAIG